MADWLDIPKLLSDYQSSLTAKSALSPGSSGGSDPVLNALINTNVNWQTSPSATASNANAGPSVISRILDLLSRGNYAAAEGVRQLVENPTPGESGPNQAGDVLHGIWSGLSGTRKTTFSDVIDEAMYNHASTADKTNPDQWQITSPNQNPTNDPNGYKMPQNLSNAQAAGVGLGGFAGDIVGDPLTYLGNKLIKWPIQGIKYVIDAARGAEGAASGLSAAEQAALTANKLNEGTAPIPASTPVPYSPTDVNAAPPIGSAGLASSSILRPGVTGSFPKMGVQDIPIPGMIPKLSQSSYSIKDIPHLASLSGPDMLNALAEMKKKQGIANLTDFVKQAVEAGGKAGSYGFKPIEQAAPVVNPAEKSLADSVRAAWAGTKTNLANVVNDTLSKLPDSAVASLSGLSTNETVKALSELQAKLDNGEFAGAKAAANAATPAAPIDLVNGVAQAIKVSAKAASTANDVSAAQKAAQGYIDSTLSKPNQFQKAKDAPSVNGPAQQTNFFNNHLLPLAKQMYPDASSIQQFAKAHTLLKVAEDHIAAQGFGPTFWDKSPLKLSEVMSKVGSSIGGMAKLRGEHLTQVLTAIGNGDASKLANTKIQKAVQSLIWEQKLKDTPYVQHALGSAVQHSNVAKEVLSDSGYQAFKAQMAKQVGDSAKIASGASQFYDATKADYVNPASAKFGQDAIKAALGSETPAEAALRQQALPILKYGSGESKTFAPIAKAQTDALAKMIGGPPPKVLATKIGESNGAVDWFMSRVATWWGQKDLRPEALIARGSAVSAAARRSNVLQNLVKGFPPEQIQEAYSLASKAISSVGDPKVQELAANLKKVVGNLVGGSGLEDYAATSTVAGRSGMLIDDLNHELAKVGSSIKFTNDAKAASIHLPGTTIDYSKGLKWMSSWENSAVKDPVREIQKLQQAVEQLTHKYALLDELGARYGSKVSSAVDGFTHTINNSRLRGLYFNSEIAGQMGTLLKNWDSTVGKASPFVRFLDNIETKWKTGMTIYMPSHHLRNFEGDAYLAWMDGVNNPDLYRKAIQIIRSQGSRYTGLDSVEQLVGRNAVRDALTTPGDTILRTKGGLTLTAQQIYTLADRTGLLQGSHIINDLNEIIPQFKPFGGAVSHGFRSLSESVEHTGKLAHFMDILSKSNGKDILQIANEASKRVRKFHPDGMDLTDFERKYVRRVIPFYSWTRKAVPLILESMWEHPAKNMVYPKFMQGLQTSQGIQTRGRDNPFPHNQLFPDWMRSKGIGPVTGHQMGGPLGWLANFSRGTPNSNNLPVTDKGYTNINPSNPMLDFFSQYLGMGKPTDPLQGALQDVNPLMRIPWEVGLDKQAVGGPPSSDYNKYFTSQIPFFSQLAQLTNMGLGGVTGRGQKEGLGNAESFINLITALGLQGTGPYIKEAQFEERARAAQIAKDRKANAQSNQTGGP